MRTRRWRAMLVLAALVGGLVVAARLRSGEHAEAAPPAAVVTMDRYRFLPETIRVRRGDTVVWRNTSEVVHTVTAVPGRARDPSHVKLPEGAEPFHSGALRPGAEYRHTFTVPGTYRYFCIPHEAQGMVAEVIVTE